MIFLARARAQAASPYEVFESRDLRFQSQVGSDPVEVMAHDICYTCECSYQKDNLCSYADIYVLSDPHYKEARIYAVEHADYEMKRADSIEDAVGEDLTGERG